jgi:uncharacterized membrane protein
MLSPYGRFGSIARGMNLNPKLGWWLIEIPAIVVLAIFYLVPVCSRRRLHGRWNRRRDAIRTCLKGRWSGLAWAVKNCVEQCI